MKGIPKTEEHKQKISESHKGKIGHKPSEETIEKTRKTKSRNSYMDNWRSEQKRQRGIANRERLIEASKMLYNSGVSLREIGRQLNINHTTVRKYVRAHENLA